MARKRFLHPLHTREGKRFKTAYAEALNAFELLVFQLISTIRQAMEDAGLKNPGMAHALLARQTAEPLNWAWHSIFYCLVEKDAALLKYLSVIRKFNTELIEERNVLAHTAWWGHSDVNIAKEGLRVFRLRHTAKGAHSDMRAVRTGDLLLFKTKCERAADAVLKLLVASKHTEWRPALERAIVRMQKANEIAGKK